MVTVSSRKRKVSLKRSRRIAERTTRGRKNGSDSEEEEEQYKKTEEEMEEMFRDEDGASSSARIVRQFNFKPDEAEETDEDGDTSGKSDDDNDDSDGNEAEESVDLTALVNARRLMKRTANPVADYLTDVSLMESGEHGVTERTGAPEGGNEPDDEPAAEPFEDNMIERNEGDNDEVQEIIPDELVVSGEGSPQAFDGPAISSRDLIW